MSISAKRAFALEQSDGMPAPLRACVHEFGLPIIYALTKHGITSPTAIREIVREIWCGARQTGQTGGARGTIDWLLTQAGSPLSMRTLNRVLLDNNLIITSVNPSAEMIDASMRVLSDHTIRCTKREKHQLRLQAALKAAAQKAVA